MLCPNKICKQEIPDDSCFCDQCGVHLLRCAQCGFIGTSKFCGNCGGSMSAIPQPSDVTSLKSAPVSEKPVVPSGQTSAASAAVTPAASAATVVVSLPANKIFLCHLEGWNIEIADGNILGRTNGPHAASLGKFPVISSSHAKVTKDNNAWYITDLNSTNKTYVNGAKLESNVPARIKQADVVILANVTFTVREA